MPLITTFSNQIQQQLKCCRYSTLLLLVIIFLGCEKEKIVVDMDDDQFMESISSTSYQKTTIKIDSLIHENNYSIHQTGLLYYEKGRVLATLEKDIEAIGSLTKALKLFEKEKSSHLIA